MNNAYYTNGVIADKEGSTLNLTYNGLLSRSGASEVYAFCGYGTTWSMQDVIKMQKTNTGFEASIPIKKSGDLNIAFKDSANNWDNNNGMNYSFTLISSKMKL
jgi:hypothetical protein